MLVHISSFKVSVTGLNQGRIQDFLNVSQNICCHSTGGYNVIFPGGEGGVFVINNRLNYFRNKNLTL